MKKISYNSPVVLSFVFVSFVSLVLGFITAGVSTNLLFCVYRSNPLNPLTYVRLFTHVLGHGGIEHYMNNMMYILLIGPMLEEKYGSKDLLVMMVITAFVTGIANITLFPQTGLLGASGIVFMMIVLSSVTSVKEGTIPLTLIIAVVFYLGNQIVQGVFSTDNISQLTHIIGGVLGGVFGMLLRSESR